jgi:hypothetical protein
MHSLSLLTTNFEPNTRLFTTTNATSAATALCTRMAAQIMAEYPELWPETIRALIIHSAEWTDSMKEMFLTGTRSADYAKLVRHCGFGVPDLDRATRSASNSLTLVIQDELQPFEKLKGKSDITTCDMHLHDLPWPLDILESLGAADVEMRVTLSYFIEPNPGDRGINNRYRYESFGLRFDVRRPTESNDGFRRRVNRLARDEEEGSRGGSSSGDSNWDLGINLRHRGSIHSDIWRGSAVDLARRGMLAVYPALGWWKTRKGLERFDKKARYALLISIRAPEVDIDLYNAVENVVQNSALVAIES